MAATEKPRKRTRATPMNGPHPVDIHIGTQIRIRRNMLGITQQMLGDAIGITFQQVQKYERGQNRVAASTLWDIAYALEVPVNFFFEDMSFEDISKKVIPPTRLVSSAITHFKSAQAIEPTDC